MQRDGAREALAYYPMLDALRVFAAVSVLVLHLNTVVGLPVPASYPWIWFRLGLFGVEIFFAISGAVILQALLAEREKSLDGHRRRFLWRRWWRIAPLLLLTGAVDIALNKPDFFARDDAWQMIGVHLAFIHNCFPFSNGGINGPSWTLGLEMQFYLVIALLGGVLLAGRHALAWLLGAFALGLAWRALWYLLYAADPAGSALVAHLDNQLPGAIDGFAAGMLAMLAHWRWGAQAPARTRAVWAAGLLLLGLALWVAVIEIASSYALVYWQSPVTTVWMRTLIALASGCCVAACLLAGKLLPGERWMQQAGKLTYGIYLWHMPVLLYVLSRAPELGALRQSWLIVGLTLLLAVLGWRLIEKPAIAYGRRRLGVGSPVAR
ncbi:MAG: acyltransferase [Rhodanobacteraceae bacterium]|nr:acyltransferase [Rhodanobacteraceae bacterium]